MSDHIPTQQTTQEIPYGYCHCGCGQLTTIASRNFHKRGIVKGEPYLFVRGHGLRTQAAKAMNSGQKQCAKCKQVLAMSEFYVRKSGARAGRIYSYCRTCESQYRVQLREANPELYRERGRKAIRERYAKYKQEFKRRHQERYSENPKKFRQYSLNSIAHNPERRKAHNLVNAAVRRGDFPPAWTMVCERCQEAQAKHWHHHLGYKDDFKLDVIAVCAECHGIETRSRNERDLLE